MLPKDIPAKPERTYEDRGWNGWGDWLGTGTVAPRDRKYYSFKKARAFVRSLRLKNQNEWRDYCKGKITKKGTLPHYIPSNPQNTYKDRGWKGIGDWLGTGTVASQDRKYRSFKEASAFVRSLGLKSHTEWRKYCKGKLSEKGKLPEDIPSNPCETYKGQGWKGWGDWMGTGTVATKKRKYRSFNKACSFVRSLGLNNGNEWRDYCKGEMTEKGTLPEDIPNAPNHVYKGQGWKGMGDWLGTGTVAHRNRKFRPFKKARAFVCSLGLKSQKEWRRYCKGEIPTKETLPKDIPTNPNIIYKGKGWKGMGDWLGTIR